MEKSTTLLFKTTINCNGCIAKISPVLDKMTEISSWNVDTTNKDKILTVVANEYSQKEIELQVRNAGYNIEKINP